MADAPTLFDLLSILDAEHRQLDDLAVETAALFSDSYCHLSGEISAPCRKKISSIIGRTLSTCIAHFMHEHEAMHLIFAPRDYIDGHADEHDALLSQMRALVEGVGNGATSHDLLQAIETFNITMHHHRDTTDAALYRYLYTSSSRGY